MAKQRRARGQTMLGGPKPCERTLKNYKAIAATAPSATVRSVAFSTSDARDVAAKSIMSNVSYEIGLAAALYSPLQHGAAPKLKVHDGLAVLVCKSLGVDQVRYHPYRRRRRRPALPPPSFTLPPPSRSGRQRRCRRRRPPTADRRPPTADRRRPPSTAAASTLAVTTLPPHNGRCNGSRPRSLAVSTRSVSPCAPTTRMGQPWSRGSS